jgi:hypothetical protein
MSKARLLVLVGAVLTLIFGVARFIRRGEEVDVAAARPATSPLKTPFARASERLLSEVPGVYLTMLQTELMKTRPAAHRNEQGDEPTRLLLEERLGDGRQVLYFIDESNLRLQRVQVAARLRGVEDIQGRVDAEDARYGASAGIWDCPLMKGSLPTRRFTWHSDGVGLMDSYLIVGDAVSATLVIAAPVAITESLTLAKCQPVTPDRVNQFPIVPKPGGAAAPNAEDSKDRP